MPGHLAGIGRLTSSVPYLVRACAAVSHLLDVQLPADLRPVDRAPARPHGDPSSPCGSTWTPPRRIARRGTAGLADHRRGRRALLLRPRCCGPAVDGRPVRNHAKFLAIDHRFLLVTSANFSWSAEHGNVEFGVLIDNRNLAETVERELRKVEDVLFEPA